MGIVSDRLIGPRRAAAYAAELAIIALAYIVTATLSLRFASINPSATPIWPPTGLALGLMLLRGYRIWPAILVGAIAANLPLSGLTAIAVGAGNSLEALAGAWMVNRFAGGLDAFRNPVGVGRFGAITGCLAAPISATIGVLSLALSGHVKPPHLIDTWGTWWLGNFAGAAVVAPVLVLWATDLPKLAKDWRGLIETAFVILLAAAVGFVVFGPTTRINALAFLTTLPLLWGALRGRERDTASAALVLSAFSIWGTVSGAGPFIQRTLNDSFLLLVVFMISMALPSLALSAGIGSRRRALAAAERRYGLLIDAIRDYAIFMIDADGRIATWNSGASRIYGLTAEEAIGAPAARLVPVEADQSSSTLLARAAELGDLEVEDWRVRADGRRIRANVTISPIRDEGGRLAGFAKITRDVTTQREAQAALERAREELLQAQKLESLGRLTGGVAHDFNNLLMVIGGQADVLASRLDDPALLRGLDSIKAAVARGAGLTGQLLSFARRQTLAPEAIQLASRFEDLRPVLKSSLGETIELELDVGEDIWPVEADIHELELALLNLAVNARDAMPEGGRFTVRARNLATPNAPGGLVELSVADSGAGMTEEVLAKAFEPFFTTKPTGKGTGLGLSQVHGFVTQSGGEVSVASRPGEGCTVTLRLPRAVQRGETAGALNKPRAPASTGAVLLVEDNPEVSDVTAALLQRLSWRVVQASDGAEALRRLEGREDFDLVLSDIVMPGRISGLELAGRIRARRPDLPIVLATGYSGASQQTPPGVRVLRKPFTLEALAEALAEATAPAEVAP